MGREAEAKSDADAYTIGQVAAGLPVHNAYATGHPHNVGVVTGTTYSAPVHHGYTAYAAPAYTHAAYGYSGVHAYATPAIHGYAGYYYGKREADSDADAYTIGQVAAGLPVHNAYATGHPPQCWSCDWNHLLCPCPPWIHCLCCSHLHWICWTSWLCWSWICWSWLYWSLLWISNQDCK